MRSARLLVPLVLAPLLASCDLLQRPPLTETFGAPYDVLLDVPAADGTPQLPPYVTASGTLVVVVAYRGGCEDHRFRLGYTLAGDEARLWLVHDDAGDACDGMFREELAFDLPAAVLARTTLALLRPEGPPLPVQRLTDA